MRYKVYPTALSCYHAACHPATRPILPTVCLSGCEEDHVKRALKVDYHPLIRLPPPYSMSVLQTLDCQHWRREVQMLRARDPNTARISISILLLTASQDNQTDNNSAGTQSRRRHLVMRHWDSSIASHDPSRRSLVIIPSVWIIPGVSQNTNAPPQL